MVDTGAQLGKMLRTEALALFKAFSNVLHSTCVKLERHKPGEYFQKRLCKHTGSGTNFDQFEGLTSSHSLHDSGGNRRILEEVLA